MIMKIQMQFNYVSDFINKGKETGIFQRKLLETYIQTKRQKEYYDIEEVDKTSAKVRDSSKIKQDRRSNNEVFPMRSFFKEELELAKTKNRKSK